MLPIIIGVAGERLTRAEAAFIRDRSPAGFILFARNVQGSEQVKALTAALRDAAGRADLLVAIDQEGGRVARLAPPSWPAFPPAERFGSVYARAPITAIEAARANGLALAALLRPLGINTNLAPVLDLRVEGATGMLGDRCLSDDPMAVAALAKAWVEGAQAGGLLSVVKHIPGHGRAGTDSHCELPVVGAPEQVLSEDLAPFRALRSSAVAMTAHVLFPAWDETACATVSPLVIGRIVRQEIGFDGLLVSDDLCMRALAGPLEQKAAKALAAGCDLVLIGSGDLEDAVALSGRLDPVSAAAGDRLSRALALTEAEAVADYAAAAGKRDALLAWA